MQVFRRGSVGYHWDPVVSKLGHFFACTRNASPMKLGLACLACRAPCMHLFMTMLAATASVAVATSSCLASPLLEQLPQTLRFALVAKHEELDAKAKDNPGGGGNNPFSLDEDASTAAVAA